MTRDELINAIAEAGLMPAQIWLADTDYALPKKEWILKEFASALKVLIHGLKIEKWITNENDCDDFARLSAAFAGILHANTRKRKPNQALAFGELWYCRDSSELHAINIAATKSGFLYFEPQTQKESELSDEEKSRVTLVRI